MNFYWLILAGLLLGATGYFPWYSEIGKLIGQLGPYLPLLVGLGLLAWAAKDIMQGIKDLLSTIFKFVGSVLFLLVFLVMIVPVMAADTFLLGSLSHWMWKYQFGTLVLIALSAAGIGILLWKDGKLTSEFSIKYLTFFAVLGAVSIVVGWSQDYFSGVERLNVKVVKGTTFLEPAASIKLKGGDHVVIKAFGWVTAGGKDYPPQGDIRDLTSFGDWWRPVGEMQLLVLLKRGQPAVEVPLENIKSGAETVGGFDLYRDFGYYIEAEATVPEKAVGYLDVGWFDLPSGQPDSGFVRLTIQVNPHLTTKGRLAKLPWYVGVMGILVALLLSQVAASYLTALFSNKVWKVTVWAVAVLAFVYTVAALRKVGAVDFASTPNVADGVRTVGGWFEDTSAPKRGGSGGGGAVSTGHTILCPGDEVWVNKGEEVTFNIGNRSGCKISSLKAIEGSVYKTWVFPGGVEGPKEVLSLTGPDNPSPSRRPSAVILQGMEDKSAVLAQ